MKVASVLLVLYLALANAQILLNGGFESNQCTDPLWCDYGVGYFCGDNSWDCTYGTIDIHHNNVAQLICIEGNFCVDLSGNGIGQITQQFDTVAGHSYTVSWSQAGNFKCGPNVKTMYVQASFANGASSAAPQYYSYDVTGISDPALMPWVTESYTFTAANYAANINFISTTATTCGVVIDAVSVTDVTTSTSFCQGVDESQWTYDQGYYCTNAGQGFYQCYGSTSDIESSYIPCPAGTTCQCPDGLTECSDHGTETPCQ